MAGGFLQRVFSPGSKATDAASPETVAGSPTYDARIDPVITSGEIVGSERLQAQRDLHLFYGKSAPAEAFSHAWEATPSPLAAQMAGLANQRDQIERIVQRKDVQPFPGVELGHVPAFAEAPATTPVIQPFEHFAVHAHLGPSRNTQIHARQGRRRFGH